MTEYEIKRLCDRVKELKKENLLLGERCNQLLKDKGDLTDQIADIKANCDLAIEGRDVKIKELEEDYKALQTSYNILRDNDENIIKEMGEQIEKMKCCGNCKYSNQESAYSIVCKVGGVDKGDYINTDDNQVCDKLGDRKMTIVINNKTYEAGELITYVEKLEKENTELQKEIRCECTRCVYSDSPCIRSDYGVENDEDVCPNYKNVFTAYTQLKKENAELKEELKNWKDEWQEQVQKAIDEGWERTLQTIQLTKAKELLAKWVELYKPKSDTTLPTPIQVDTEQFLNSEVEK